MHLNIIKDYRNKFGIVDLDTNNLIVPHEFDEIIIKDTCVRLKLGSKWGMISVDQLYMIVFKLKYLENHPNDTYDD